MKLLQVVYLVFLIEHMFEYISFYDEFIKIVLEKRPYL